MGEQNPGDGTAWAVMGLSEFALKDYGNARVHLQRGIRLGVHASPQAEALAIDRLALLMIRNGKFDSASALLSPLARASATNGEVRLALGLALFHIAVLPENLNAEQRDLAGQGGTIVELLLASRYPEAFAGFEKLIAAHPETPWLHYAYGDALNDLSEYDKARTEMQAETKISPKSALPWIRIASIDVRQHMAGDALEAAHKAVALAPGSAEAHYQLGRAWLESGDAQRAIAELNRANGLRPGSPEIHFALARAYSRANLPEKAAAERTIFLQLKAAHQAGSGTSILQGDARR